MSGKKIAGYLQAVNDSSMVLSPRVTLESKTDTILSSDIHWIKIKGRFRNLNGVLIGIGSGAAIGYLIGYVSYTPCDGFFCFDREVVLILDGIIGGYVGAATGLLISLISKKNMIKGNQQAYVKLKPKLEKYIIVKKSK
jgi:hypothetical protein